MRLAMCMLGLLAAASLTAAAKADTPLRTADDAVPGHPGVTYLDLLKQAIPSLAANDANHDIEGHLARPLRHLAGKTYEGDPPDPVVVGLIEDVRFRAAGKPRIAILVDLGADPDRAYDTALLALYDDASKPKLLDVVDVGVDKEVSFGEPAKLPLGPGDDALVAYSEHFNTSATYEARVLAYVRHDQWRLVDNVFLFADRACGWDREETPSWSTAAVAGAPYREIDVKVVETLTRAKDADCGDDKIPRPYVRVWHGAWRWDAKKQDFIELPDTLRRLDKLNAARF